VSRDAKYYFQQALEKLRNRHPGALADLEQAIQLDPENPRYYLECGSLRFKLDEFQAAFEDFSRVILFSQDLDILLQIVRTAYSNGHGNTAVWYWRNLAGVNPG